MAVRCWKRGLTTEISLPTDANKDFGIFLMFVGLFATYPLFGLVQRLVFKNPDWDRQMAALISFVVVVAGLALILFSRKRLSISEGFLQLKDGLFGRRLKFQWQEQPLIRLYPIEEEQAGKTVEAWLVNLVDGKSQYTLDRRIGQQMASRTLAEMIAKTLGCGVVEKTGGQEVELGRDELDLPFVERVHRHPVLLGPEVDRPEDCAVEVTQEPERYRFRWRAFSPNLLTELIVFFSILLSFSLIPLVKNQSLLDLARFQGEYLYFIVLGSAFLAALVLLGGLGVEVVATREQASVRDLVFGLTYRRKAVLVGELEDIAVRHSARGAYLQFISDAAIVSQRLADLQSARWVAGEIRRFYAQLKEE